MADIVEDVPKKKQRRREDLLTRFGCYLKERRKQRHWTLRELAERAGMQYSAIHQYEVSGKDPRLTELQKLAGAFNESLLDFMLPVLQTKLPKPEPPGRRLSPIERKEDAC